MLSLPRTVMNPPGANGKAVYSFNSVLDSVSYIENSGNVRRIQVS